MIYILVWFINISHRIKLYKIKKNTSSKKFFKAHTYLGDKESLKAEKPKRKEETKQTYVYFPPQFSKPIC